jgi:hypothetical protein
MMHTWGRIIHNTRSGGFWGNLWLWFSVCGSLPPPWKVICPSCVPTASPAPATETTTFFGVWPDYPTCA